MGQSLKDLKKLLWRYRAYARIVNEQYDSALNDLKSLSKLGPLDAASLFNKNLCLGLSHIEKRTPLDALPYLDKAILKFPQNQEPYLLKIIALVKSSSVDSSLNTVNIDNPSKQEVIKSAISHIDLAIEQHPSSLNLYFY